MTSLVSDFLGPKKRSTIFLQDNPELLMEFDAVIRETHQGDAQITDHPVEEGSDISDHVRRQPESLQLSAIVSDFPIVIARSNFAKPSAPGGDPNNRAKDAYDFLDDLKNKGFVVGLSTSLRDYRNMVITSLGVTRDKDSGNMASIQLALREITIAQTETVAAPEPVNASRKKKTKLGKKQKKAATPATETKTSLLVDLIGSIFGR